MSKQNSKRILSVKLIHEVDDSPHLTPEQTQKTYYIGIQAQAEIKLRSDVSDLFQTITSGGLWGIESDSDASYIAEIEQEQLSDLKHELTAIGFSKRAISKAFKDVERQGD